MLTEAIAVSAHVRLWRRGFRVSRTTRYATYYSRPASSPAGALLPPVLFLHGIGVGLVSMQSKP